MRKYVNIIYTRNGGPTFKASTVENLFVNRARIPFLEAKMSPAGLGAPGALSSAPRSVTTPSKLSRLASGGFSDRITEK